MEQEEQSTRDPREDIFSVFWDLFITMSKDEELMKKIQEDDSIIP